MNGDLAGSSKKLKAGPKVRICYICGRAYGINSYEIHLKQCKELWIAREALKEVRERKPVPEDPLLSMTKKNEHEDAELTRDKKASSKGSNSLSRSSKGDGLDLDALNKLASEVFNTSALSSCGICGRTFLPEKLAIHNKSCTPEHPHRRVDEPVRRGRPYSNPANSPPNLRYRAPFDDAVSSDFDSGLEVIAPAIPKRSSQAKERGVAFRGTRVLKSHKENKNTIYDDSLDEDVEEGAYLPEIAAANAISGHLGGIGGRDHRRAKQTSSSSISDSNVLSTSMTANVPRKPADANVRILEGHTDVQFRDRLDIIEKKVRGGIDTLYSLLDEIADMKEVLRHSVTR